MDIVWIIIGFFVYLFVGSVVAGLVFKDDTCYGFEMLMVFFWPIPAMVFIPAVLCITIMDWTRKITRKWRK